MDAGLRFLLPNLYCLRQIAGVLAEYVCQFWYSKVYMHSFLKLLSWLLGYMGLWWVCWCMKAIIRCFLQSFRLTQSCCRSIILFTVVEFLLQDLRSNSQAFSRRLSFGSSISDSDRQTRFAEPAYSFVGMHCIFDNCKASGDFWYLLRVFSHFIICMYYYQRVMYDILCF